MNKQEKTALFESILKSPEYEYALNKMCGFVEEWRAITDPAEYPKLLKTWAFFNAAWKLDRMEEVEAHFAQGEAK
jgi:hypothetical protein